MFSVIFPGQGSQIVGMTSEFYSKYDFIKKLYKEADETLNFPISKLNKKEPSDRVYQSYRKVLKEGRRAAFLDYSL